MLYRVCYIRFVGVWGIGFVGCMLYGVCGVHLIGCMIYRVCGEYVICGLWSVSYIGCMIYRVCAEYRGSTDFQKRSKVQGLLTLWSPGYHQGA